MTTQSMLLPIIILLCVFSLFIYGKFRADIVALAAMLLLGIIGILEPMELLAGFSNPITIILASLYIVGAGVFNTGLVEKIFHPLLKWSGGSERRLMVVIMLSAGVLGGILSSTGIVAIMLPIVMSTALKQRRSPSKFLIPLAFASGLGGLLTVVGTPSNLIINDVLTKNNYEPLAFFSLTPIGLITLLAALLLILFMGKKLLPHQHLAAKSSGKDLSAGELAGMYKVYDRLHYLQIPQHSDLVGERLSDLVLPINYEITVIEIKRKSKDKQLGLLSKNQNLSAKADEVFHPDDIILVFGEAEAVTRLTVDYELETRPFNQEEVKKHLANSKFGMTEILIMPHSDYENQTLRDIHFREKYQCSVLAINRKGEYIQADLGTEILKPGDALLIHGEWVNIEMISADLQDIIVLGSATEESDYVQEAKAPIAASIVVLMILLLAFNVIPQVYTILMAAFLMVITGCVRSMEEAYQRINWESIILLVAMFPLMAAFEKSGGLIQVSIWIEQIIGDAGPYSLLALLYILTLVGVQFVSNIAITMFIAPIAFTVAVNMHYSPVPILVCVTVAAALAFSTPRASSTNALVMTAGDYNYKDFAIVGIGIQVLIGLIVIVTIPFFFPF